MITLSVSGRSEGRVASSNINLFLVRDGSLTELLSERLDKAGIELPFEVLSVFVDAKPHSAPANPARASKAIRVRSNRKLMRFTTGQAMKSIDLVLDNDNFYTLSKSGKHEAIAVAFREISAAVRAEYPGPAGAALAQEILFAAQDYLARQNGQPDDLQPATSNCEHAPND